MEAMIKYWQGVWNRAHHSWAISDQIRGEIMTMAERRVAELEAQRPVVVVWDEVHTILDDEAIYRSLGTPTL